MRLPTVDAQSYSAQLATMPELAFRRSVEKPFLIERKQRRIDDQVLEELFVVLKAPGCWYRQVARVKGFVQCPFCTLPEGFSTGGRHVDSEHLAKQVSWALSQECSVGISSLDLVNSGSFFDDHEISEHSREVIATAIAEHKGNLKYLTIESKVNDLTGRGLGKLDRLITILPKEIRLIAAFGLEVTDPIVGQAIGKRITPDKLERLMLTLAERQVGTRWFCLLKPVPMSRDEAKENAIRTIQDISALALKLSLAVKGLKPCVSIAPTRVYPGSALAALQVYEPPTVEDLLEVLSQLPLNDILHQLTLHISLDPTDTVLHNGRLTDQPYVENFVARVKKFNLSQDSCDLPLSAC